MNGLKSGHLARLPSKMESPDVEIARYATKVSLWALYVSGAALVVSAGLLVIEIRRRLDEGVKLALSIIVDAKVFGGAVRDENTYLSVSVTNRGSAPTAITHMILFDYPFAAARWLPSVVTRWIKKLQPKTYFAPDPSPTQQMPYFLEPGRIWMGKVKHTPSLRKMIEDGNLYVGIIGSHRDAAYWMRARRRKLPKGVEPGTREVI